MGRLPDEEEEEEEEEEVRGGREIQDYDDDIEDRSDSRKRKFVKLLRYLLDKVK